MPRRIKPRAKRIKPDKIAEIRRLHAAGNLQKEIVRLTGVSRASVGRILRERPTNEQPARGEPSGDDDAIQYFSGPVERCPRCGRKVHMPCMPCRVDSMTESGRLCETEIQHEDRRQIARDW